MALVLKMSETACYRWYCILKIVHWRIFRHVDVAQENIFEFLARLSWNIIVIASRKYKRLERNEIEKNLRTTAPSTLQLRHLHFNNAICYVISLVWTNQVPVSNRCRLDKISVICLWFSKSNRLRVISSFLQICTWNC